MHLSMLSRRRGEVGGGGEEGGRQGMGRRFDIFQKFAFKFPAHGQKIPHPGLHMSNISRLDLRKAQKYLQIKLCGLYF